MALEDYESDIMRCNRCSYCKHVPHDAMKDARFLGVCPSIEEYGFHSRSASGRLITALSILRGRIELDQQATRDIIYQCQMCGGCDVSCKVERDLEPYEIMQELRFHCAEQGVVPEKHLACLESLKKSDNILGRPRAERGDWADGLGAKVLGKDKSEVLFHAGCQYSFDPNLRNTVRNGLGILLEAGVDVGILGQAEICCGGQSHEMGFREEAASLARRNVRMWKSAGVKTVVTPCAACYRAFSVLYDKMGMETGVEVVHLSQFIHKLVLEGKIQFSRELPLAVTYHDPCHLGRLAEPWVHWQGQKKKVYGQMVVHDPPKQKRFGVNGVYDVPREILNAIPGLKFTEMHRIREYAWCCGSGAGIRDAYPGFARSTAVKRLEEAESVGAEVIVSSCPRCKQNFEEAANEAGKRIQVMDLVDLVQQAISGKGEGS